MLISNNYFDYFRSLAVSHRLLRHDPETETGNVGGNKKRFARFSVEEILNGLSEKIKFPALLVDQFEMKTSGSEEALREDYSGAITVLATADQQSAATIEGAFDSAGSILNDMLRKMYQDSLDECKFPFERVDFNGLVIIPIGPVLNSEFGWRCEFNFSMRNGNSITEAPEEGVFL